MAEAVVKKAGRPPIENVGDKKEPVFFMVPNRFKVEVKEEFTKKIERFVDRLKKRTA